MAKAELSAVLKQADEIRHDLLSLGNELKTKSRSFELPKPDDYLLKLLDELDDNTYQVLVIGEAKRGKSTLVNALIGRSLLPTNVDIATSQAFRICPSNSEAYRLRFEDGSAKEITVEELGRYGSQVFAEGDEVPNRLNQIIRWIEVDVPARFIPPNVRIIDTPGLGSLYASHGQVTRRFIPYAHAVIFVLESQAPIGQPETDLLEEILAHTQNIFFVQTKIDQFIKEDWQSIRRRNEAILKEKFGDRLPDVRVWPVSSVNLQKAVETGDPDYEIVSRGREMIRSLQEFLFYVAGWSRLDHVLRLLQRYHRDGEKLLSYRLKMLEEGEQKLREAHRELSTRRDRLQRDWGSDGQKRRELERQLDRGLDSAEKEFAEALSEFCDRIERQVMGAKSIAELKSLGNSLPQRLSRELENAWDGPRSRYQTFVRENLKAFLRDLRESAIIPPVSDNPITVRRSNVAEIPQLTSSIDLATVSRAVLTELPEIGAGAALLSLGNWVHLIPLIGSHISPFITPIGIILIGYSLLKITPKFWEARQRSFEAARNEFLSHLGGELKKIQKQFLNRLDNPLRQTLGQVRDQILEEVDAAVDRRLADLADEIARLDENCQLAARERQEKSFQLRRQISEWNACAAKLNAIEGTLEQVKQTYISA